jgi:hypothetical protein
LGPIKGEEFLDYPILYLAYSYIPKKGLCSMEPVKVAFLLSDDCIEGRVGQMIYIQNLEPVA